MNALCSVIFYMSDFVIYVKQFMAEGYVFFKHFVLAGFAVVEFHAVSSSAQLSWPIALNHWADKNRILEGRICRKSIAPFQLLSFQG